MPGGVSEIAGGNGWQGALQGAIIAGLNHFGNHAGRNDPDPKKKHNRDRSADDKQPKGQYYSTKPEHSKGQEFYNDAKTLKEWVLRNNGKSIQTLMNERERSSGLPGGPTDRYLFHPVTGNVIDLRHVFVVAFRLGGEWFVGSGVEVFQGIGGLFGHTSGGSAFHEQDFYSNNIGNTFYHYSTGRGMLNVVKQNPVPLFDIFLNVYAK